MAHSCTSRKRGEERQVRLLHFELASDSKINNERITNRAIGPCNSTAKHTRHSGSSAGTRCCVQRLIHPISVASLARLGNQAPCPLHELKGGPRVNLGLSTHTHTHLADKKKRGWTWTEQKTKVSLERQRPFLGLEMDGKVGLCDFFCRQPWSCFMLWGCQKNTPARCRSNFWGSQARGAK